MHGCLLLVLTHNSDPCDCDVLLGIRSFLSATVLLSRASPYQCVDSSHAVAHVYVLLGSLRLYVYV